MLTRKYSRSRESDCHSSRLETKARNINRIYVCLPARKTGKFCLLSASGLIG
jgi:hypothetical protein